MTYVCPLCNKNQTPYSSPLFEAKPAPEIIPSADYEAKGDTAKSKEASSLVAMWFGCNNKWYEGSMFHVLVGEKPPEDKYGRINNHTMWAFDDGMTYNFFGKESNYGVTWVLIRRKTS